MKSPLPDVEGDPGVKTATAASAVVARANAPKGAETNRRDLAERIRVEEQGGVIEGVFI